MAPPPQRYDLFEGLRPGHLRFKWSSGTATSPDAASALSPTRAHAARPQRPPMWFYRTPRALKGLTCMLNFRGWMNPKSFPSCGWSIIAHSLPQNFHQDNSSLFGTQTISHTVRSRAFVKPPPSRPGVKHHSGLAGEPTFPYNYTVSDSLGILKIWRKNKHSRSYFFIFNQIKSHFIWSYDSPIYLSKKYT
jgi:hypothetical protein